MNIRQPAALALAAWLCMSCESAFACTKSEDARAEQGANLIEAHRAAVGGVTIGSSESDVVAAFGKPASEEESFDEPTAEPSKYMIYDGIEVYLVANEIYAFRCSGPDCETYDGVKVGDSLEKVMAVYGEEKVYPEDDEITVIYDVCGSDSALIFHLKDDRVVMIQLYFNYV